MRCARLPTSSTSAVDPRAPVWRLSVGERQKVEILKALYRGARTLILDEPTTVLTPQEVDRLFALLRGMVENGGSVVFISHKLHEVLSVCDRVTVLREGRTTGTLELGDAREEPVDTRALARMMVGRDIRLTRREADHAPVRSGTRAEGDRPLGARRVRLARGGRGVARGARGRGRRSRRGRGERSARARGRDLRAAQAARAGEVHGRWAAAEVGGSGGRQPRTASPSSPRSAWASGSPRVSRSPRTSS